MNELKSKTTGKLLILLLWVGLILSSLSGFFTIFYIFAYDVYFDYLLNIDDFISIFNLVLYYISVILFLVWLYKIHQDLNALFWLYPIQPSGALIRMLPVIYLWGFWSTYSVIATHFNRDKSTKKHGRALKRSIPLLYIAFIGNNIINRLLRNPGETSDYLYGIFVIFDIGMAVIILVMALTITKGIERAFELQAASHTENIIQESDIAEAESELNISNQT